MRYKRYFVIILCFALLCAAPAYAANFSRTTWNSSDESYAPYSGALECHYYLGEPNYAKTYLTFKYSASAISAIRTYNSNGRYTGMDIKTTRPSNYAYDMMDAYSAFTSLPDPKIDLENNDSWEFNDSNDEADVVVLGTLTPETYYTFNVEWYDYRGGGALQNGTWHINAELSYQILGIGDYNTDSYDYLAYLNYGNTPGEN